VKVMNNRTYQRQTMRRRMQAFGLQMKSENEWYEGPECDGGRKAERSGHAQCSMAREKRKKLVKKAASLRQNGDQEPTCERSNSTACVALAVARWRRPLARAVEVADTQDVDSGV